MAERLPCQVCGRQLVPLKDGTSRRHSMYRGSGGRCPGSGYRLARWEIGQLLRHHSGSFWEVVESRSASFPDLPGDDYVIRCLRSNVWDKEGGHEMVTHCEYMHRHGWTPLHPDLDTKEGGTTDG